MNDSKSGNKEHSVLIQRTISSLIAIPIIAACVWFGEIWFTILVAGWSLGTAWEFYHILQRSRGLSPFTYFGMAWVLFFVISPHLGQYLFFAKIPAAIFILTAGVILSLVIMLGRRDKENAFTNWTWTLGGILYIGWLLSQYVALRRIDTVHGGWVFLALFCTFASDSSAYLVGRVFGKHKMAPYISPKKSWEGAAAAVAGAGIISIVVSYLFNLPLDYWQAFILGILISILGQLGDLVKSLFKRNMEIKDSGKVLPGHGGFLDRMDSLAFTGVMVYYFVVLVVI